MLGRIIFSVANRTTGLINLFSNGMSCYVLNLPATSFYVLNSFLSPKISMHCLLVQL